MRLFRNLLALLIAVSLAALPIGVSAATLSSVKPALAAETHAHAAMDHAMHMAAAEPCHQQADDDAQPPAHGYKCPLGFCCVGATCGFSPVAAVPVEFPSVLKALIALPTDHFVPDHAGSPPFRPPRV